MGDSGSNCNPLGAVEFDPMPLTVVERQGRSRPGTETVDRPIQAGRRILAAGQQHEGFRIGAGHESVLAALAGRMLPRSALIVVPVRAGVRDKIITRQVFRHRPETLGHRGIV